MILRIILIAALLFSSSLVTAAVYDYDGDGVTDDHDCAASNSAISPMADDEYGDGKNTNCDGVDGVDADGDGFAGNGGLDCNDHNNNIHPGATEQPGNNIDENCDGLDDLG